MERLMRKTAAVIGLLFTTTVFAASFDCSKAGTPIEKAICLSSELSDLDDQLASAYRVAATSVDDRGQLKSEQRMWITQVRNKCEDTNCLALAYSNRINALRNGVSAQPLLTNEQTAINHQSEAVQLQNTITPESVVQQASSVTERPQQAPLSVDEKTVINQLQISQSEQPQNAAPLDSATQQQVSRGTPEISQQTLLPVSDWQVASVEQETAELPSENNRENKITSLQLKLLGLALLANVLVTIYFHKTDKLTIYEDYTDAAFTGITPLVAIATYFVLRFFEVQPDKAQIIAIGIFTFLMIFVVKSTARNNNGLSIFFAMSLITKVVIVGLYYAIMAALIFGSGSARKKGERSAAYEARKRREAKANAAAMAGTTAGFVALSVWVCKYSEFTPIKEYFSSKVIEE
jgi:uncharacterized protein